MNQTQINKKQSLSSKHKLILSGFILVMTFLYLSALSKGLNIYKETFSWLNAFKSIDWLGAVILTLLGISLFIPV
ncbi:hypothetical protein PJ15_0258 [Acinetobacter sp. neg1]|uniref:hypothetical protein n=1 Tax=Acinetobacter sp. neg1 TaxID=1561068 RepID=UPI000541F50B|nr:hypothetical protein [Acinetobacter sp. neg1]KHF76197.1 hypothetical protein PJ15_0258 [Acinetobacter sp. neg1]